jgi:hypothetical protein
MNEENINPETILPARVPAAHSSEEEILLTENRYEKSFPVESSSSVKGASPIGLLGAEPHIAQLYALSEYMYVEGLVSLITIQSILKKWVSLEVLTDWKNLNKWDKRKTRSFNIKVSIVESARELVHMTLAVAKVEPSAANITSYKRAIESLIVLERLMPPPPGKSVKHLKIKPEHIAEIASAAGFNYTEKVEKVETEPSSPVTGFTDKVWEDIETVPEDSNNYNMQDDDNTSADDDYDQDDYETTDQ